MSRLFTCFLLFAILANGPAACADELQQSFISSGITRKTGGYSPSRAEMDQEADIVKVAPDGLQQPKYGVLEIGEQSWTFILDEPEEGEATLYLDTNGDGDLTNDPAAEWTSRNVGEFKQYSGQGQIDLGDDRLGTIKLYRFDASDERRAALKNTMMFYPDYGFEYDFKLDGKEFSTFIAGMPSESMRLPVDRDGNEKLSRRFEQAVVGEPFNFTGTTYVFKASNNALSLEKSDEAVDQLPLPPDLAIGKSALNFQAKTMDETEIDFPKSFAGKLVMLDFWATWCGPCIGEIPNMKQAYADWNHAGFEILGISFDAADMEEKINAFLEENELPWQQIYEGKQWETTLGIMHDVSGIPYVLLVDGDSGEILATASQLRGKGLSDFVGEQLKKKFGESAVTKAEPKAEEPAPAGDSKDK